MDEAIVIGGGEWKAHDDPCCLFSDKGGTLAVEGWVLALSCGGWPDSLKSLLFLLIVSSILRRGAANLLLRILGIMSCLILRILLVLEIRIHGMLRRLGLSIAQSLEKLRPAWF